MNWIRISVDILDDARIDSLALSLSIRVSEAVGCVVGVLTKLPAHAKDGDLSHVSDRLIESWAHWEGKRGRFAAAFRAQLCTEQGVVRSWERYNGSALREVSRAAERAKEWRDERKRTAYAERSANVRERVPNGERTVLRNETRRDVTNNNQQTTLLDDAKSASPSRAKPEPKFPHFPTALTAEAHEVWQSKAGAMPYARLRKALAPLFTAPEAERPPRYPRDAELVPAVSLYLDATGMTTEAKFRSPERCAAVLSQIVGVLRGTDDPLKRLDQAEIVVGVRQQNGRAA